MKWEDIISELKQNSDTEISDKLISLIHDTDRIFVAGTGRSELAVKSFAMRLSQMGKIVFVVGETNTPSIGESDLLLVASSSGETEKLVSMVSTAKKVDATIWLWSTNLENTIARTSTFITLLSGKSKFSTNRNTNQPMGSLFEQSVWLYGDLFTMNYMNKYKITEEFMKRRHSNLE